MSAFDVELMTVSINKRIELLLLVKKYTQKAVNDTVFQMCLKKNTKYRNKEQSFALTQSYVQTENLFP